MNVSTTLYLDISLLSSERFSDPEHRKYEIFMIDEARMKEWTEKMIPKPPTPNSVPEIPEVPRPISGPERIPPPQREIWEELERIKKRVEALEEGLRKLLERTTRLEGFHKV